MKLIKDLNKTIFSGNRWRHIGLFFCDKCKQECEKIIVNGIRAKSCGCAQYISSGVKTHGLRNHPLYKRWSGMKQRCSTSKAKNHIKHYQKKGIKVCKEWDNDFKTFYDWAISHGYNDSLELDRKNSKKGYSPNNCRFISQIRNKRRANSIFDIDEVKSILELKNCGFSNSLIAYMFKKNSRQIWRIGRESWNEV